MAKLTVPVTAEDHVRGDAGASVTLLEYGDYQCPHCRMAHAIVGKLAGHYGSRLRFAYRNFPLEEIHPLAEPAAEAAEFAGAKGKFWEMHDAIFAKQRELSEPMLAELAEGLGLDGKEAGSAIREQAYGAKIEQDVSGGLDNRVHGTPTFFINGERYEGAWEYDALVEAIDSAM